MKRCRTCGQPVAEKITTCPSCGSEVIDKMTRIDGYRIEQVLHEGHATILCRAVKTADNKVVIIRIFKAGSGVDEAIAARLQRELEKLKKLPPDYFVRHFEICRSEEGLWYRVSEWNNAISWGALMASGKLQNLRTAFDLFRKIAGILDKLHHMGHTIPHLILDDVIVIRDHGNGIDVRIDYKLSRFLDPKMDRPGPMLKKLLDCHPDMVHHRPVDRRSDIWSLGKIFVEILSGDHETVDFRKKIDVLPLPPEIRVLFKIMLADDPDLRPRSMAQVADTLGCVTDAEIEKAGKRHQQSVSMSAKAIGRMNTRLRILTALVVVLVTAGIMIWMVLPTERKSGKASLENYADRYAGSVAFLMAEYQLMDEQTAIYKNRVEGTAFLVDKEGYLLTNRHVACPWLEDNRLHLMINRLRILKRSPHLNYRLFLWFEGEKAFKRFPEQGLIQAADDAYYLETAYQTGGKPRLEIAGVARMPITTRQIIKSPLRDDFAVLKIDHVPKGLIPMPIQDDLNVKKIGRLSPVITLGFPLGSQAQEITVNTSVTRGHVRRTFDNLIQVDTSIHHGNSGGPLIDTRGMVIGIASRVAMGWSAGPIPVATQLPDMGMVLPINKAALFLKEIKAGKSKWRGGMDLFATAKLNRITQLAREGKWDAAVAAADLELEKSSDPRLVIAGAMMHFCIDDLNGATRVFDQSLSMNRDNGLSRYMLFVIEWLLGRSDFSSHRNTLLAVDWRSPLEFFGHLAKILEGAVTQDTALSGGYSNNEKSWIRYTIAFIRENQGDLLAAEALLKEATLGAGFQDWLSFLALARLQKIWKQVLLKTRNPEKEKALNEKHQSFLDALKEKKTAEKKQYTALIPYIAMLSHKSSEPKTRIEALEMLDDEKRVNGEILSSLAFYNAMIGQWEKSLEISQRFLNINGRETATRLSMGVLEPQLLLMLGHKKAAKTRFNAFIKTTNDVWYRQIARCLTGDLAEKILIKKAEASPEYLVTAHMALGLKAESNHDPDKALKHYKEALGSYMDDWLEYEFCLKRIKKLKGDADNNKG